MAINFSKEKKNIEATYSLVTFGRVLESFNLWLGVKVVYYASQLTHSTDKVMFSIRAESRRKVYQDEERFRALEFQKIVQRKD